VVRILLAHPATVRDRFSGVEIFSDYIGVAKYANGQWSAARASTKTPAFRSTALRWEKALRELRGVLPVTVAWVRGHSGDAGNDRADALARSAVECNTFARLFDP
jgi:ribonuclease HI